jgi:phosphopantothenoylcysteine decarboxylase/phosphopantothenate--cysteine ligase
MNERVLLGVTGSIAAYKACLVLRRLRERGFRVPVIMTEAAGHFIGRVTFESLSTEGVYDDLWARREALSHISLLEDTRLVLVAPATADIIAESAHGLARDLLSSLILAAEPRLLLFAPAMNEGMWNNPATQENIALLRKRGAGFVEPAEGELACGMVGKGRLAEIEEIVLAAERLVRAHPVLSGRRVVVTAGRTEEELDPVRVITNRSSGMMGVELAKAFARVGADVTLIAAQVSVELPFGITTRRARSAAEMLSELRSLMPATDVLLMAAAVADYRPGRPADAKLKDEELTLSLSKTPDILGAVADSNALCIGFSVETGEDWVNAAVGKLASKRLDAIVANPAQAIGSPDTQAVIVYADGERVEVPPTSKEALAAKLVEVAAGLLGRKESRG